MLFQPRRGTKTTLKVGAESARPGPSPAPPCSHTSSRNSFSAAASRMRDDLDAFAARRPWRIVVPRQEPGFIAKVPVDVECIGRTHRQRQGKNRDRHRTRIHLLSGENDLKNEKIEAARLITKNTGEKAKDGNTEGIQVRIRVTEIPPRAERTGARRLEAAGQSRSDRSGRGLGSGPDSRSNPRF